MKLRKIFFVTICLISLLLLLTSCSKSTNLIEKNYKTGYGNLEISTMKNYPTDTVYTSSDFRIIVKLDNNGAYKLTNGKLKILGFDDNYVVLEETKEDISSLSGDYYLEGKSSTNPNGEFTYIEFEGSTEKLFSGSESYKAPYIIKADYEYKTELSETVCVNQNLYDTYQSGCQVKPKVSLSGQGSPLAVTEMEEIIQSGGLVSKIEFRFKIKNQGKGKVKQATLNKATLGNDLLNCWFKNNPGLVKNIFDFPDKQETVLICTKSLTGKTSYETVVFLDLGFKYSLEEKKSITIKS
ncbi:hypothetical protein ACFL0E_00240 [Nanoarchaeota archaeon]